ncbi:tyrosine recombinase, partial [Moniliophthora roreri]
MKMRRMQNVSIWLQDTVLKYQGFPTEPNNSMIHMTHNAIFSHSFHSALRHYNLLWHQTLCSLTCTTSKSRCYHFGVAHPQN